jgi:hypothetical protein
MNKNFYIIVPLSQSVQPVAPGFIAKLFRRTQAVQVEARLANFEKLKVTLNDRVNSLSSSLSSVGLRHSRLSTEQLIELLYFAYNFESAPMVSGQTLSALSQAQAVGHEVAAASN